MENSTLDESASAYFRSKEINRRIVSSQSNQKNGVVHKTASKVTSSQFAAAIDNLPSTAKELIEAIGLNETIALIKAFGGGYFKVPEVSNGTARIWPQLVELMGQQAAEKFVWRFAGTQVYIPICTKLLLADRDREIIRRFDAGDTLDDLYREFRITKRHLYRILKKTL